MTVTILMSNQQTDAPSSQCQYCAATVAQDAGGITAPRTICDDCIIDQLEEHGVIAGDGDGVVSP